MNVITNRQSESNSDSTALASVAFMRTLIKANPKFSEEFRSALSELMTSYNIDVTSTELEGIIPALPSELKIEKAHVIERPES